MAKCEYCGKEVALPFRCKYCNGTFCVEHHLPEKHECQGLKRGSESESVRVYPEPASQRKNVIYIPSVTRIGQTKISTLLHSIEWDELTDLTIATLAIYIIYLGLFGWTVSPTLAMTLLVFSILTYVPHELAHKFIAQYYGLKARYKLFKEGLLITLLSSLLPIKVISPGSVLISGLPSRKILGVTALSGPLVNLLMALFISQTELFGALTDYFVQINLWIALFNLIPLGVLDGKKILEWSFETWLICFLFTILLFLI
ncbi:MAG TPA: hypothetical protein ENF80_00115 [Thermofilum sp.]|nr:hypothetical protein [Thermofilum sp.]